MFDIRKIQEQVIYEAVKMRAMKILRERLYMEKRKMVNQRIMLYG